MNLHSLLLSQSQYVKLWPLQGFEVRGVLDRSGMPAHLWQWGLLFLMLGRCRTSRNAKWPMSRWLIRDQVLPGLFSIFWQGLQGATCHICHISNRPWALNWPWNVKSSNFLVVRASAESMGNSSKSGTNMAQKHGEIFIFMEPHHKSPVSTDDSFKLSVLVWRCKKKGHFLPPFEVHIVHQKSVVRNQVMGHFGLAAAWCQRFTNKDCSGIMDDERFGDRCAMKEALGMAMWRGAVLTFVQREETVRCRSQEDSHFFRDFGGWIPLAKSHSFKNPRIFVDFQVIWPSTQRCIRVYVPLASECHRFTCSSAKVEHGMEEEFVARKELAAFWVSCQRDWL